MSEHDVPAGRDELRERLVTTLATPLGVQVNRAIEKAEAALLAPQEAPAEGISLSAQLSQAAAWMRVWDECQRLGMDTYGAPSTRTGLDIVLDFIRGRAAPQEARKPEALRQTIAEAVERLADYICPAWRVNAAEYADEYMAVVSTIDGLAGRLARFDHDEREPTKAEIDDACMWYRHDFGLMSDEDAGRLRFTAREWLRAWHKAGVRELLAAAPAPEAREPEVLGYVVERQLTTGEWMRVWRGSTMWFDHDEAVLDRDAYALDGIPARIRPVYLGAPAPAEGRQALALDAIRDVLGIDYDEDSAMWYLPAEPAPIECATLGDALRAYAKMAAPASGEPSEAKATPLSDAAVARIIEAVEAHCGMGRGAWDMVAARDLVEGFAAALGADTRRIDALDSVLLPTAPGAPEEDADGR